MKKRFFGFVAALSLVIPLSPVILQAASPASSATAAQPQAGGILKVIIRNASNAFSYPPRIIGSGRDYAAPIFDRLLRIGDDGEYKPDLALSWVVSADGKAITFKLRQGVKFHDSTTFNAQAVKANIDKLIPPNGTLLSGITSVDVVDEFTVKFNLPTYNNLIFLHLATNPVTFMYSPEALKKNGEDWAMNHPVGTGPFMLKDYQPNISLTLVKNPNYWQKGLPYLDGIELPIVGDPTTQMLMLKAGQANAIYDATTVAAAQLREGGYPLMIAPGGFIGMSFDTRNSPMFSKLQVRQAVEYAIDKEAICSGPGQGLVTPIYQLVSNKSPDYNKDCPPRLYDPAKAKKLLAEAGYPNGFSFKMFLQDTAWKDGWIAVQSYLDKVGIKMDINYINTAAWNLIRSGEIEKGTAVYHAGIPYSSNTLLTLDSYWRSDVRVFSHVVRPAGIDKLIDQAKLSRDPAAIAKINRQVLKAFYDEATVLPVYQTMRLAVLDKSVQNTGWFINSDDANNQLGIRTWLKK